jgi:N-acetylneuraminic acid mutarotase
MPDRILDSGSAVIGHDLYAVGGKINGDDHQKTLYVYHASTNSWSKGPDLPGVGIENPAATARNGKLFVFGGSTSAFSGAVANAAVYDPGTNKWTVLKPMPSGRAGATAQALGGKIYVIGGMDGSGHSLASVAVYDVANDSWSSGPTLTTPRDNPGSAVLADSDGMDKIFVFGGRNRGTTDILASVEVLDGGTWKSQSPMPTARRTMAVGMLNGNAQLIGGERPPGGGAFDENEEYEPSNDSWRTLAAEPTGRHGTAYGTIGGKVYVIGGATGTQATSYQDVNEVFSFGS